MMPAGCWLTACGCTRIVTTSSSWGLPRGGIPVAGVVAEVLGAPMDALIVRKVGVPGHEEVAVGAIGPGGVHRPSSPPGSRRPAASRDRHGESPHHHRSVSRVAVAACDLTATGARSNHTVWWRRRPRLGPGCPQAHPLVGPARTGHGMQSLPAGTIGAPDAVSRLSTRLSGEALGDLRPYSSPRSDVTVAGAAGACRRCPC